MENLNKKIDDLLEEFVDVKKDLLDNRNKISALDQEFIRRNSKLMKLEAEVKESKTKCLKVEAELNNYKVKVVNLEEDIEKRNSKIAEVESELIESKGKVLMLEQKLNEYESRPESQDEAQTDLTSTVIPKKEIKDIKRRLKVLEEKTDILSNKAETEVKLKYVLNGLMLKAQKNFQSDLEAQEESLNPSQDDVEEDQQVVTQQEAQDLPSSSEETLSTVSAVLQTQTRFELPLPEDSVDVAFSKCQDLVRMGKIFLGEDELLTLCILEEIAGVKNGPAAQFAHRLEPSLQDRMTLLKIVHNQTNKNCNSTRAKYLYQKSCTEKFSSDSYYFYMTATDINKLCILEVNQSHIKIWNFYDKKEERLECYLDELMAVDKEDDLISLLIEQKNSSVRTYEILQSDCEEIGRIFDTVQHFMRKSDVESPHVTLKSIQQECKGKLKFIKSLQENFGEKLTLQAYVEICRLRDSDSFFFFVKWPVTATDMNKLCILEVNQSHIKTWSFYGKKEERIICELDELMVVDKEDDLITLVIEKKNSSVRTFEILQSNCEESELIFDAVQHFRRKSNVNPHVNLESIQQEGKDKLKFIKYQDRIRQHHVNLTKEEVIELAAYETKLGIKNGAAWSIGQQNFEDFEKYVTENSGRKLTMQAYVEICRQRDSDSLFFFVDWYLQLVQDILEIKPDGMMCFQGCWLAAKDATILKDCINGEWACGHNTWNFTVRSKELQEIISAIKTFK